MAKLVDSTIYGSLVVTGGISGNLKGSVTGNADTATVLKTSRTFITNLASTSSVSFNGGANVSQGVTGILAVANGGTGSSSLSSITVGVASKLGTATVGSATLPMYLNAGTATACGSSLAVSVTGNANTATTLATSRTFITNLASTSTVSFNGGANVSQGVTGTLAVTNGGTGATSLASITVGTASKLGTATVGSSTLPMYLNAGTATACGSSLAVSITGTASKATADASGNTITSTYATKSELSSDVSTLNASIATKVNTSLLGVANGVATLDSDGTVPSSQLPSYVDDILEGYYGDTTHFYKDSAKTIAYTPETGKIYVSLDTNLTYRWSGSVYTEISQSLALGETSSTAYRGDRGKIAYDHTSLTNNPHSVTKAQVGLGSADNTADSAKVVLSATGFTSAKTITLTGNVTGSASGGNSTNGWSIATTIPASTVTNAMLAGSIANAKLANSSITIGTTGFSLGGSSTTLAGLTNVTSTLFTGVATQVQTLASTTSASYYPTFVDSNNSTVAGESVYTSSSMTYNPSTNYLNTNVSNVYGVASSTNASSHVWFSDGTTETARVYDADFSYNPSTNVLTVGSITGSAPSLTTARTIAGVSFNGTANIAIPFANLSSIPTTVSGYGITDAVTTSGNQTIAGTKTFSSTISGSVSGNAGTATALQTARTIAGVSFNGTKDIDIPFSGLASKPTTVAGYGITDAVTTSGNQTIAGTKTFSSTISGSVNGNSATTTKLYTARSIAGVSFNGTADIDIPFANLVSKPTTVSGYGITDAITTAGGQTIGGTLTVTGTITGTITKATGDASGNTITTSYASTLSGSSGTTAGESLLLKSKSGATLSTVVLDSASSSVSGVVNTTTQTFVGAKTFTNDVTASSGKIYIGSDGSAYLTRNAYTGGIDIVA